MEIVTIKWSGPYGLHRLNKYDISLNKGIYAIYQVIRGRERLLYIGKTSRCFLTRINEHHYWLQDLKGECRIRLGVIESGNHQRFSQKKLDDIESLLITWHAPSENTTNSNYYYGRHRLTVLNIGRRGSIKKQVCTDDLEWA